MNGEDPILPFPPTPTPGNVVLACITNLKLVISCFTYDTTEFDRVRTRCYTDGTESLMTIFGMSTLLDAVPFVDWKQIYIYIYNRQSCQGRKDYRLSFWSCNFLFLLVFLNVFLTFRLRLAILDLASVLSADWTFSYADIMIFPLFVIYLQFLHTKKENSKKIYIYIISLG